jgi:hypothetical protein
MNQTTTEEDIFCRAVEIQDTGQREAFLRATCQSNAALRQAVDALLADHEQATRLFQEVAADVTLDESTSAAITGSLEKDDFLGAVIGPYHIVQRLGEGGGGTVYEAEQDIPVRRKVAVKILKPGLDKWRVMNRFQTERQALELMEHPNIARVLDAGTTPDSRPYFVMELVRGTKITDHCKANALPMSARLQLIQRICSAVQHAHQKGIIHCDLKPSNILVTMVEGTPIPKVIDFGIAKATGGTRSELNDQNCPVGTPAYMSPEQIDGSADIDTRSDIYSLGVILYELLAGRPPFKQEEPSHTGTSDLRHRLLHETPPPPSLVAAGTDSHRLKWNEDLDCIVMTAMEKNRERRYSTVRGLSQDIARYLANEPISARPAGRLYRMRKFVRRNRVASGAIAAVFLALAVGFTASSLLYFRADAAERKQTQLRADAEAAERRQAQLRADAEERAHVTKAAILIMQNKTEDADAEIQLMGGMLTQPSVEATNVFHKLATWNALRGNWKAASQRMLSLSRVNRFDDSDMTDNVTRDLVPIAPTLIEAGDLDNLRDYENFLLQQLGNTNNPVAAEQVLKICLQYPPSNDLLKRLQPAAAVAEKSISDKSNTSRLTWIQAWRCFALGLWDYRIGEYEQSIPLLNLAMTAPKNEPVVNCCCLVVRSMAYRKMGHVTEADNDLVQAKSQIDAKFSTPLELDNQGLWHDWLTARILLREATSKN